MNQFQFWLKDGQFISNQDPQKEMGRFWIFRYDYSRNPSLSNESYTKWLKCLDISKGIFNSICIHIGLFIALLIILMMCASPIVWVSHLVLIKSRWSLIAVPLLLLFLYWVLIRWLDRERKICKDSFVELYSLFMNSMLDDEDISRDVLVLTTRHDEVILSNDFKLSILNNRLVITGDIFKIETSGGRGWYEPTPYNFYTEIALDDIVIQKSYYKGGTSYPELYLRLNKREWLRIEKRPPGFFVCT